ncbi:ferric reductase-like transmembrane domain-containing protein [Agromyces soli]
MIWGTSLSIAVIWVLGGGVQATIGGGPDALDSLGRLTGLASANLLLYQVLLMARVPVFERGLGRDAITRLHRQSGFWSFWLLVAHIALLVFGYAQAARLGPLEQLWGFVWAYPGMLLATAGTLLLVLVVVTSLRRARRKLRYESWHLLHLYAYLGVGLAIPHMLWTGADFTASPIASVYWWGLWGAAAACVLVWRIVLPLRRSARHGLRVAGVRADGDRGIEVRVRGRALDRLHALPGQFFVWRFLDGPGWSRGHPFSLAAAPGQDELVIAARTAGDGTRRMAAMRPGTRVLVEGPYGTMTGAARTGRGLLMLGAGAGVAPLLALLEGEAYASGEATLVTRNHLASEALRIPEIQRLQRERGVVHFALDGERSQHGPSWVPAQYAAWSGAELLCHLRPDLLDCDVFVCGPAPWMTAVLRDLRAAGVGPERLHHESFTI